MQVIEQYLPQKYLPKPYENFVQIAKMTLYVFYIFCRAVSLSLCNAENKLLHLYFLARSA